MILVQEEHDRRLVPLREVQVDANPYPDSAVLRSPVATIFLLLPDGVQSPCNAAFTSDSRAPADVTLLATYEKMAWVITLCSPKEAGWTPLELVEAPGLRVAAVHPSAAQRKCGRPRGTGSNRTPPLGGRARRGNNCAGRMDREDGRAVSETGAHAGTGRATQRLRLATHRGRRGSRGAGRSNPPSRGVSTHTETGRATQRSRLATHRGRRGSRRVERSNPPPAGSARRDATQRSRLRRTGGAEGTPRDAEGAGGSGAATPPPAGSAPAPRDVVGPRAEVATGAAAL